MHVTELLRLLVCFLTPHGATVLVRLFTKKERGGGGGGGGGADYEI